MFILVVEHTFLMHRLKNTREIEVKMGRSKEHQLLLEELFALTLIVSELDRPVDPHPARD